FNGRMLLADLDPPNGYTLKFEGQGGAAGFANGEARVSLAPADPGKTTLTYVAKAQVGGKLAQIGSRLIDGAAAKMADDFFARFAQRVAPPEEVTGGPAPVPVAPMPRHWVRYLALAAIAIIIIVLWLRGFK